MQEKIYDFIIIGGGSGGIGAAVEANAFGFKKILLIEKGENHSQTIRKYYRDNKRVDKDYKGKIVKLIGNIDFKDGDKKSTLNYFDALLDNRKIDTMFNCEAEKIEIQNGIFNVNTNKGNFFAKNVVVAIGIMGKPNKPNYKLPISLSSKINFDLNKCSQSEKILVVGGGNSAAEYAILLANNNDVRLNYRKEKFTRLNERNKKDLFKLVKKGNIKLILGIDIVDLNNENGKIKVTFEDGKEKKYDRIIYAIGGSTPVEFLKKCGIKINEKGFPLFDQKTFETNIKNLYVCGDLTTPSAGSIAIALNQAYMIVKHVANQ